MDKNQLIKIELDAAATSPRAKSAVIIGYIYDATDAKGNPQIMHHSVSYSTTEVQAGKFFEKLQFIPTRPLQFTPNEDGNINWPELQKQLESDFNSGKIYVIWDGAAPGDNIAPTLVTPPKK